MAKEIVLPPTDAAGEAKVKGLLDKIAEFMGVKLSYQTKIIMTIEVPEERADAITVVNKIVGSLKKK